MAQPCYTILSFCGGGVRGVLSAKILERLWKANSKILTKTSLLAGTSTGAGIVSAIVGPKATTPDLIVKQFYNEAANFYSGGTLDPTQPRYHNEGFLLTQANLHGKNTLASLLPQQVLFTAYNVGSAKSGGLPAVPWSPLLFTNVPPPRYLGPRSPVINNANTSIVEAVVSSGSMPGMLPSYKGNVDGAFVHHDPTIAAIALAVNSGIDIKNIAAICIGTGFMANWIGSDTSKWGASQWLRGDGTGNYQLPDLVVNEEFVQNTPCPMLNISLNGTSSTLMPTLAGLLLGSRYVSLNPTLDKPIPENESKKEVLDYMVAKADLLDLTDANALVNQCWGGIP